MSTKSPEELPSIDLNQLSTVTGGVTTDTTSADMTAMMQQIVTSLADMTQNQGSGSNNMLMEMLPMMMMMRSESAPEVAYAPEAPVGNGSGWTLIP